MTILILRGHIRESFDDDDLYHFVKKIITYGPIEIYISTWNVYSNNLSWRHVKKDDRYVDKDTIYDYFRDVKDNIKHIIIEDDKNIKLIGNTEGNVGGGKMPLRGWKNMWYGNYNIIQYLSKIKSSNEIVINTRIDILKNSNRLIYNNEILLTFIKYNIGISNCSQINKNIFVFNKEYVGIDNIFSGTIKTMQKLITHFQFNMDSIISSYGEFKFPHELLVFRENEKIY